MSTTEYFLSSEVLLCSEHNPTAVVEEQAQVLTGLQFSVLLKLFRSIPDFFNFFNYSNLSKCLALEACLTVLFFDRIKMF